MSHTGNSSTARRNGYLPPASQVGEDPLDLARRDRLRERSETKREVGEEAVACEQQKLRALLVRPRQEDDARVLVALVVDPEEPVDRKLANLGDESRCGVSRGLAFGGELLHSRDEIRGAHAARSLEQPARARSLHEFLEGHLDERLRQHRDHVRSREAAREILEGVRLLAFVEPIDERVGQHDGKRLGVELRWFRGRDARLPARGSEAVLEREAIASETPYSARMPTSISLFPPGDESQLSPEIQALYGKCREKLGFVPNVFLAYQWRPSRLAAWLAHFDAVMEPTESLPSAEREMIAVAVSMANACSYCLVAHGYSVRKLTRDPSTATSSRSTTSAPRSRRGSAPCSTTRAC